MKSTLLTALGIGMLIALPQALIGQEPPPEKEKQKQEDPKKPPPPPKREPERPKPEEPKREPAREPKQNPDDRAKQDEKEREKQEKERKSGDKQRERRDDQNRRSQEPKRENRQSVHSGRGQRIPQDRFRANFGREHHFRVGHIDNGRRFVREGVTFELVEVWPTVWSYDDDFFIEDDGDDYYLVDVIHPEIRVLVIVI